MKMNLTLFLLAFSMFWKSSKSVRCYKCIPEKLPYDSTPPCTHFNYSKEFIVECSSSTMCFKRVTSLDLGNGLVTKGESRGCAAQTLSGDQRRIDGKWRQVHEVYEVYEDACKESPSDYLRPTKTINCYCRGDLCNGATNIKLTVGSILAVLIFFFVS